MLKRFFDLSASLIALAALSPVLLAAALGIKLTSRGTVLFRASRAGKGGAPFTMYKFRTMHENREAGASRITAAMDSRVFGWGKFLRRTKIDELPQLFNVVNGTMSIVGPRPEDAGIVREHYTPWMMETLNVPPGMASPGSIYGSMYDYRREAEGSPSEDPEADYIANLLPMKLAIELVYVRKASLRYDLGVIFRTVWMIIGAAIGRRTFAIPAEYAAASEFLESAEARKPV